MKSVLLFGAACAAFCTAAPALAATVIDTTYSYDGDMEPFGEDNTATYGQTFSIGSDNVLTSFSLFLDDTPAAPLAFKAYVYAWDGSKATGPALYTSNVRQFTGTALGNPKEFSFATGSLQLASGGRYVAFLSTSEVQDGNLSWARMPMTGDYGDLIPGGGFVYFNNGADFGALTTTSWDYTRGGFGDAWFKAHLVEGVASAVPETATWALMLGGFGLLGTSLRGRREQEFVIG